MKKRISLNKGNIIYKIKISKRARRMRVAVYCDGSCVITVPKAMPGNLIEKFIIEKSQWIIDKIDFFRKLGYRPRKTNSKAEFIKYKDKAMEIARNRIEYFNSFYNFSINRINIRNQKTRWGSCSKKGNLNFNYKIALLPQNMSDYIIVHELCHLREFNHSQNFWNLVAKTAPDYLNIRRKFKRNGANFY
jgi:predicted metal-dependent hydrolase